MGTCLRSRGLELHEAVRPRDTHCTLDAPAMSLSLVAPLTATRRGTCPGCGGTGQVHRFVPVEGTYVCASCGGGGTVEAMEEYLSRERGEYT